MDKELEDRRESKKNPYKRDPKSDITVSQTILNNLRQHPFFDKETMQFTILAALIAVVSASGYGGGFGGFGMGGGFGGGYGHGPIMFGSGSSTGPSYIASVGHSSSGPSGHIAAVGRSVSGPSHGGMGGFVGFGHGGGHGKFGYGK